MTIRDLLKKPFWTPKDLALVTGVSISTARSRLSLIRLELSEQGFINLNKSQAPVKIIIERLAIDLEFLEKTGALDIELDVTSYSKKDRSPNILDKNNLFR